MSILLKVLDKIDEVDKQSARSQPIVELSHKQSEVKIAELHRQVPQQRLAVLFFLAALVMATVYYVMSDFDEWLSVYNDNANPAITSHAPVVFAQDTIPSNAKLAVVASSQAESVIADSLMALEVVTDYASYSWVNQGRSVLDGGDVDEGLKVWQEGLTSLSNTHALVLIAVYRNKDSLLSRLDTYLPVGTAVGLRAAFKGREAYFLLGVTKTELISELAAEVKRKSELNAGFSSVATMRANIDALASLGDKQVNNTNTTKIIPVVAQVEVLKPVPAVIIAADKSNYSNKMIVALIDKADYSGALKLLKSKEKNDSADQEALYLFGTAYLGLGDFDQADAYFSKLLSVNSELVFAWLQRAVVAQERGSHELALNYLNAARAVDSSVPEIYLNYGYSYEYLAELNLSRQNYQHFLQLTSQRPEYYGARESVLQRLERL